MNGNLEVNKCLRQLGLSLKIDTFNKILRRKHFFEDVRASGEHVSVDRDLLSIANEDPIGKGRIVFELLHVVDERTRSGLEFSAVDWNLINWKQKKCDPKVLVSGPVPFLKVLIIEHISSIPTFQLQKY